MARFKQIRIALTLILAQVAAPCGSTAFAQSDALMDAYSEYKHYEEAGNLNQAAKFAQETLEIARMEFPANDEVLADRIIDLAAIELQVGAVDIAVALYKEALQILDELPATNHDKLGMNWLALAKIHDALLQQRKAKRAYSRALKHFELAVGPDHAALALVLYPYASSMMIQARDSRSAIKLLKRLLAIYDAQPKMDIAGTMIVLHDLAALYNWEQRHELALEVASRGLAIAEPNLADDPDLARPFHAASYYAYFGMKDHELAAKHYPLAFHREGGVEPLPLKRSAPSYPLGAARRGLEGRVLLSFTITEIGSATDIKVLASIPDPSFGRAAARAVKNWIYAPPTDNKGNPTTIPNAQTTVVFRMK